MHHRKRRKRTSDLIVGSFPVEDPPLRTYARARRGKRRRRRTLKVPGCALLRCRAEATQRVRLYVRIPGKSQTSTTVA
jgi:hypothetical protein